MQFYVRSSAKARLFPAKMNERKLETLLWTILPGMTK
jgi:hypothetical protein